VFLTGASALRTTAGELSAVTALAHLTEVTRPAPARELQALPRKKMETRMSVKMFEDLVLAQPPSDAAALFETACVLGGSVGGLLAARVLADHAREVVIVERDMVDDDARRVGNGAPQERHLHTLLPGGMGWLARWLPGFIGDAERHGACRTTLDKGVSYFNDQRQHRGHHLELLLGTRPLLESCIRRQVLALPNVSVLRTTATGLEYRDGAVSGVRHSDGVLAADFVVDAMGRASRLSDWLGGTEYSAPSLERLHWGINYATGLFRRQATPAEPPFTTALAQWTTPVNGGLAICAANVVEDDQWIVTLAGFGDDTPGRTVDEFRTICAGLPEPFDEAVQGPVTRDIEVYHQADSRRRDFTGLPNFPRRLVSVGDAVASFNPIYGQGMSCAALHASCLSSYLTGSLDLDQPADDFFALQKIVVDAAWSVSAGSDSARLDAVSDVAVPQDVQQQRWLISQILEATVHDASVTDALEKVTFMLAHPETLGDPTLVSRAVAVNQQHAESIPTGTA
jgi:2-polyprenyl-6-methoxyphenol hydroxylase-like FAD-dependent oxidoreductase